MLLMVKFMQLWGFISLYRKKQATRMPFFFFVFAFPGCIASDGFKEYL